MKEETSEFVRKLRNVIKAVMWIWVIGVFVFCLMFNWPAPITGMVSLSDVLNGAPETRSPPRQTAPDLLTAKLDKLLENSSEQTPSKPDTVKEATPAPGKDWGDILLAWAIYGIAPAIVLGLILPDARRKKETGTPFWKR